MRLLQVAHQYPPDHIGGVELHTRALADGLAARGHEVAVFYRGADEGAGLARRTEGGVQVWRAWHGGAEGMRRLAATFREPSIEARFAYVLASTQPDLVHFHHLMGLPVGVAHRVRRAGVPYLITLHDYWWGCPNAQLLTNDTHDLCDGPRAWVNCGRCALARAGQGRLAALAPAVAPLFALRHRLLRQVIAGATFLITPTQFAAEVYAGLGLPTERVRHIPHGIELPPTVAPRTDLPPGALRVSYVGGIAWQKGVHVLVAAMDGLPDGVTLRLYGDLAAFPEYAASLRARAQHPGIRFEGAVGRKDLWARLAEADVLVVPSLWYETAALVVQEAFAAGLPVVASDLGALRERVRDGIDGLHFPSGDVVALRATLRRLRDEPGLLARLRAGIRPVRTVAEQVAETEALYGAALGG